jgi:pimeloyl-ACP methyl ester carboxylesterase
MWSMRFRRSRNVCAAGWTRHLAYAACSFAATFGVAAADEPASPPPRTIEIAFETHDGYPLFGKLTVPTTEGRHPVVVYVQTAEAATVDTKRPDGRGGTFNYFDLYRAKLPSMGVAFFSYEGRGVRMGDQPPLYEKIDRAVYDTSTLDNKVRDVLRAVRVLRERKEIDPSRVLLMGASEGTLLAAEAASRAPDEIGGLVLYAVLSTTMKDALEFMCADGRYLAMRFQFDDDKDGRIRRAEFDADSRKVRERAMQGVAFEHLDLDKDGTFTQEEMRVLRKPLLDAIEKEDLDAVAAFLETAAKVSIPKGWLEDHFAHAPIWTFLSPLKMPVGLFQGTADTLTSVEGVRRLEAAAQKAGRTNLEFHYFEDQGHSLGIGAYFVDGRLPDGHRAILDFVRTQTQPR